MVSFYSNCKVLLLLMSCLAQNARVSVQGKFGIVKPFPENIYPLESSSAQVTCAAFDSTGIKIPDRIEFRRKNRYAEYTTLKESNNLHFTNRTELVHQGGEQLIKIFATMYIKKITLSDDSTRGSLGRYECHAFAVNDTKPIKHGFSVNVISREEIPTIHVTKPGNLQRGQNYTLMCNVTSRGSGAASLLRISWFKNGILSETVRLPDPDSPKDFLKPLMITDTSAKDGGVYICLLEVLVRRVVNINVTDGVTITVTPWFVKPKVDIEFSKDSGQKVSFECGVKGFPLEVEWQFERRNKGSMQPSSCINGSDEKYEIIHGGITAPYILTVSDLQYRDSGFYYCCFSSNCSSSHPNKDNCQRFILNVEREGFLGGSVLHLCDINLLGMLLLSMVMLYARNEL